MDSNRYVEDLSLFLKAHADSLRAFDMKRYMRDQFEYFGISSPMRKDLFRKFIHNKGLPEKEELEVVCKELFVRKERELQYFAMEMIFLNHRKYTESDIKLFEYMIVTASWWDTVDYIAPNIIGKFFKMYPEMIHEVTMKWMKSGNIWLQRACLLFQLKYKKSLDTSLLYGFINELKSSKEFFIQKSIGWILREYSKTNPEEVLRFVESNELKPLSRREALKIIRR